MTKYLEMPDLEAVARTTLQNAAITNLGTRVYSSIPNTPTYPLATVKRTGGPPAVRQVLDAADLEIEVWGTSKTEARDIAATARVKLLELEGSAVTVPVRAWISGVNDSRGLTWEPDTKTGRDKYVFGMTMYGRVN